MNASAFLLCLTAASLAGWASLAVAQTPATLGVLPYAGLTITGQVDQGYYIEYSTNLDEPTIWIPLDYVVIPHSPYLLLDRTVTATSRRFYRAREAPVPPVAGLVYIPAGKFTMGSPESEAERRSDETQHQVTLTRAFWMGRYEVTQGEFLDVIGRNPSAFRDGVGTDSNTLGGNGGVVTNELRHPVENVSWGEAMNYCRFLTRRELAASRIPAGWRYRLPTEAEWEYACRGGTTEAFHYGPVLVHAVANFDARTDYDSSLGTIATTNAPLGLTSMVGSYSANAFGLFDMHGNVWEWCSDWSGTYPSGPATDPLGPNTGRLRVIRGGSWLDQGRYCRSAFRHSYSDYRDWKIGFRVVLALDQ